MLTCCLNHRTEWPFGAIGAAGVHFHAPNRSLSGHDPNITEQLHELADGGTFVDSSKIPDGALVGLVVSGPLLDLSLPPNWVRPLLGEPRGLVPGSEPGPYDNVGLDIYVENYRKAGSRIGCRKGDSMVWEDGTTEDIAPCTCWKHVCPGCNRLRHYDPDGNPQGPGDLCPECRRE